MLDTVAQHLREAKPLTESDGPINPDVYVAGDINGDGEVNDSDVTLLMQYYAGWQVNVNVKALDVNGDMHYNNKDVTRLIQYLAGWDVVIH